MFESFETEEVELSAPALHGWHFDGRVEINYLLSTGDVTTVLVDGFRIGNREQLVMSNVPIHLFGESNAKMMLPIVQVGERVTLIIAGKGTVKVKLSGRIQKHGEGKDD